MNKTKYNGLFYYLTFLYSGIKCLYIIYIYTLYIYTLHIYIIYIYIYDEAAKQGFLNGFSENQMKGNTEKYHL